MNPYAKITEVSDYLKITISKKQKLESYGGVVMFSFFKKKPKEKSCFNCKHYDKKGTSCKASPKKSYLRAFPFKKTTCKTYEEK